MKIIKTASGKKIKMSKTEWESVGKQAGWMKEAQFEEDFDSGLATDTVDELVEKSLRDPQALKEFLRDNPEMQGALSDALVYQNSGVSELDREDNPLEKALSEYGL